MARFAFYSKVLRIRSTSFCKKFCEVGHSSLLAMNYIDNLKKFCKLYIDGEKDLEDIIDVHFLIFIDPNFMIIEDDE